MFKKEKQAEDFIFLSVSIILKRMSLRKDSCLEAQPFPQKAGSTIDLFSES